jgi:adenosylmethionine-8-amino-7-oxononanoate aminotransferase
MQEPYSISVYPGNGTVDGRKGDHVILSPPYNVTEEEIDNIVDLAAKVIEDFFANMEH